MATTEDKNIGETIYGFFDFHRKTVQQPFQSPKTKEKKYTKKEIAIRLNDLFNRIVDSSTADYELCEDIRYVGQCEGLLSATGDLSDNILRKLNDLWKKYKNT